MIFPEGEEQVVIMLLDWITDIGISSNLDTRDTAHAIKGDQS